MERKDNSVEKKNSRFLQLIKNLKIHRNSFGVGVNKRILKNQLSFNKLKIENYKLFFLGFKISNDFNLPLLEEYFKEEKNVLAIVYFNKYNFIDKKYCYFHIFFENEPEEDFWDICRAVNEEPDEIFCYTNRCTCPKNEDGFAIRCDKIKATMEIFYDVDLYFKPIIENFNEKKDNFHNIYIFWQAPKWQVLIADIMDLYNSGLGYWDYETWYTKD